MNEKLPKNFTNIPDRYKRQMKDVEFVSLLLLFVEQGPTSYSQLDLDIEFVKRDDEWEERASVVDAFSRVIEHIALLNETPLGAEIPRSRLRTRRISTPFSAPCTSLPRVVRCRPPMLPANASLPFSNRSVTQTVGRITQMPLHTTTQHVQPPMIPAPVEFG